jgi:glycosyltransferase involved in cell wall biosynthesis
VNRLRIPAQKVLLIPNGVDAKRFEKSTGSKRAQLRRQKLNVTDDDVFCVGMVGRLWEQKNPACLLRAAVRVLEKTDKPVQFFFIGDGQLRPELEQFIADHGLQSSVQIMGWRQDVAELLSVLDVFVLPSLWEGMPLAILEAMASKLPVIASDISGNHDLVTHGVDGILFDSDNDEQLADALLSLMNSPSMREELGAKARDKVFEHYQVHDRVERVSNLYLSLLAGKREKGAFIADRS